MPDRINLYRANALRSVGGNTFRCSHNPYRPAVYNIMDRLGVLVWYTFQNLEYIYDLVISGTIVMHTLTDTCA
eukprot:SAG31_NODE_2671_length_5270_cov_5.903114_7_plen_73_part_00